MIPERWAPGVVGIACHHGCHFPTDKLEMNGKMMDTSYRHLTSSCQGSILQSSTHMLLPFWNPTKHPTSSWNFFPECHCALSLYRSMRMLFVSISVTTFSTFQLSPRFFSGADTLRRSELPLGFPSLLLHS